MIKVNPRFEFERDTYGWKLHDWSDGVNPKTREPTRTKRTTYHPNLEQVCNAVIDREAGDKYVSTFGEILMSIKHSKIELLEAIKSMKSGENQ